MLLLRTFYSYKVIFSMETTTTFSLKASIFKESEDHFMKTSSLRIFLNWYSELHQCCYLVKKSPFSQKRQLPLIFMKGKKKEKKYLNRFYQLSCVLWRLRLTNAGSQKIKLCQQSRQWYWGLRKDAEIIIRCPESTLQGAEVTATVKGVVIGYGVCNVRSFGEHGQ